MNEKLTVHDWIEEIARRSGVNKSLAEEMVHRLPAIIEKGLLRDGEVRLKGLGVFRLRWVAARSGRNPQTGESIAIPGHSKVVFKAEKKLRDYVNRPYSHLRLKILKNGAVAPETHADRTEQELEPEKRSMPGRWVLAAVVLVGAVLLFYRYGNPPPQTLHSEPLVTNSAPLLSSGKPEQTLPDKSYIVSAGDNLWDLSSRLYKNPYYWPVIYRQNVAVLKNPDGLTVGVSLIIPQVVGEKGRLSEQDSINLSAGYLAAHQAYKRLYVKDANDYLLEAIAFRPITDRN
jgi:nucleoid DNA-binding protein